MELFYEVTIHLLYAVAAHGSYPDSFFLPPSPSYTPQRSQLIQAAQEICDNDQNNALHFAAVADEKCCKFVGQRGCNPKVKNQDGQLPRNLATQEGKKLCVRELRKLEKSYGKTVKNTDPWALRLYDWSVVHTDELTERFKELGQYLAEQAEEARQSQLEEAKANEDTAINPEEASPTAVGATAELDTARSGKSTASRKSPRGKKKRRRKKKRDPSVGSTGRTLTPVTRMYVENFENVLQSLSAPYGADCLKELIKFHEKNSDGCIGWQEFLTGKKYVNKNYLMSAFAGKKGKKRRGRKGGRGKRKTKIPLEICTLPKEAIFRRADGGPPIMYIPKQHNHTDPNRFDAEHPPLHPIEDDSVWYINPPKRQYISFHTAAKYSDLDSIRLALSEGYNVDTRDKFYKTPLMVAAHHGNLDAAIALIQLGADVNARDNFKWTPLHHAAHSGMIDVVELLLRNGAVIDARALNGGTPLFRAIECSRLNVVNYIMSQGAKIMIETRKGNNPYDAALAWADPRVIDLVHDRWELAQELADKNKQKKGSSKGKRPGTARSTTSSKRKTPQITPSRPAELPGSESRALNHMEFPSEILARSTTLELANATQEIRYCPKYPWLPQPTRAERLARLAEARERFGWDHGLPGVPLHPFDKNLKNIVKEAEAEAGAG
ncbi:unnamed protein product [Calicophoron daubneyi]|uniref:Ankyrin repeat and EF-hand domain-containing protein 1 n=1 Tax=Calicophoron daubneyi TaxID=300641 RepID=A0AAV2TP96_CALDB